MALIKLTVRPAALPRPACPHQPRVSSGLCFSVPQGVAIPPSLRNVSGPRFPAHCHALSSRWLCLTAVADLRRNQARVPGVQPAQAWVRAPLCIMVAARADRSALGPPSFFCVRVRACAGTLLPGPRTGSCCSIRL